MSKTPAAKTDGALTRRQVQCLEGFWARKSAKEIGAELGITHHAVEKHLQAARQTLGVGSSIEAARRLFGPPSETTAKPYYDASEVPPHGGMAHAISVPATLLATPGMASERAPINRFGPALTLLAIVGVAVGSILAIALLVTAAQGLTQLWATIVH
jgi:DNA-binding CsgD family transcriptional regulator